MGLQRVALKLDVFAARPQGVAESNCKQGQCFVDSLKLGPLFCLIGRSVGRRALRMLAMAESGGHDLRAPRLSQPRLPIDACLHSRLSVAMGQSDPPPPPFCFP